MKIVRPKQTDLMKITVHITEEKLIPGLSDFKASRLSTTLAFPAFLEIPLMKCIAHLFFFFLALKEIIRIVQPRICSVDEDHYDNILIATLLPVCTHLYRLRFIAISVTPEDRKG